MSSVFVKVLSIAQYLFNLRKTAFVEGSRVIHHQNLARGALYVLPSVGIYPFLYKVLAAVIPICSIINLGRSAPFGVQFTKICQKWVALG